VIELVILALALTMDAFAVSLVRGSSGRHSLVAALELGAVFGLAQGFMPLAGWALGALFTRGIEAVDHWIAFALLGALGVRMIHAAFSDDQLDPAGESSRRSHFLGLLAAAIATSVDAAAAGLTLELFALPVWLSCCVIAFATFLICTPGYWFSSRIGPRFGRYAEGAGGVVLIGLGTKILLEHLG